MVFLEKIICICDSFNKYLGRMVSWGVLIMVLLMAAIVLLRYTLNFSAVWQQELVRYVHIIVFMSSAGYALLRNDHVRVDIFYQNFSTKKRLVIDAVGTMVLLIPFALATIYYSYEFIANSWHILEPSPEPLGLPAVYIMKSFIGFFAFTLVIQSISIIANYLLNYKKADKV